MPTPNITIKHSEPAIAGTRTHTAILSSAHTMLRSRFFMTAQHNSQTKFYDTLTDSSDLGSMHLIPIVMEAVPEYRNNFNEAKAVLADAIKHGVIQPLSMGTMKYRPNCGPVVNIDGINFRNLWRPSSIKPTAGDAGPFVDFLMLAMGGRKAEVNYFIKWLALLVQDPLPVRKPPVAVYIFGSQQGQGKSLLADIITKVLGKESVQTSSGPQALEDKNRTQYFSRTLFVADEARLDKKQSALQAFKNLITSNTTEEALKNQSVRTHEVPARLMMLSNYSPAHLEREDRRHFVVRWDTGLRDDDKAAYFNGLVEWLENGGYGVVSHFLANYNAGDWDYAAPAMMTDEKLEVIQSHAGKWSLKFADLVADEERWFVDQNHDFNSWISEGFNVDRLPYLLEQLGWQALQGKDSAYRHRDGTNPSTTHRYWFSPEVSQKKEGNTRVLTYKGQAYSVKDIHKLQRAMDEL